MIAALILVISLAALFQFFVSYCRSLIAACNTAELSPEVQEVAGLQGQLVPADEFERLLQFVHLCPAAEHDRNGLRAVSAYFRLMSWLRALVQPLAPRLAAWAEAERAGCGYFAAVALDRRIMHSRELMAAQMSQQL